MSPPRGAPLAIAALRWLLAGFYIVAGVFHLNDPEPFLLITPDWVPFPKAVIAFTGICEILGAVGLISIRFRKWAGIMLAVYAVCVWPANLKHAFEAVDVPGLPQSWWYHGPRLAFQPVLVWLALYSSGATTWPFRKRPVA